MSEEIRTKVYQSTVVVSAISRLEQAGDYQSVRLLNFLACTFREKSEIKFGTLTDVKDFISENIQVLDDTITNIVDQVEDQIIELKTSILSLNELLPMDPLKQSGVYVFNTTKNQMIEYLKDPELDTISSTPLGDFIRSIHIHADLVSEKAVHGIFIFFPLGSLDKSIAQEHATEIGRASCRERV